jgi:hypothetical protein
MSTETPIGSPTTPPEATEAQWREADKLAEAAIAQVQSLASRYVPDLYPTFYRAILERLVATEPVEVDAQGDS